MRVSWSAYELFSWSSYICFSELLSSFILNSILHISISWSIRSYLLHWLNTPFLFTWFTFLFVLSIILLLSFPKELTIKHLVEGKRPKEFLIFLTYSVGLIFIMHHILSSCIQTPPSHFSLVSFKSKIYDCHIS